MIYEVHWINKKIPMLKVERLKIKQIKLTLKKKKKNKPLQGFVLPHFLREISMINQNLAHMIWMKSGSLP